VLVDEYQDINECRCDSFSGQPRVSSPSARPDFQPVRRRRREAEHLPFFDAEPARFLARQARFKTKRTGGTVIDLRSIFAAANPCSPRSTAVFERLMTADAADIDYDDSHRLRAGLTYPSDASSNHFPARPSSFICYPEDRLATDNKKLKAPQQIIHRIGSH